MSTGGAWRALYKRDWSLIPLRPDKKCYIPWKQYQHERASVAVVKDWLAQWPECNPGVVTGKVSGIIVVDIDGAEGIKSLGDAGFILRAPVVETARGYHYYFAYPDLEEDGDHVITKAGVLPSVDVRGDGGYVVGPGAVHESGAVYSWRGVPAGPFPQAPRALLDLIVSAEENPLDLVRLLRVPAGLESGRAREYALAALRGEAEKVASAPDGGKHDRLLRSACAVAGFVPHVSEGEIEDALYSAIAPRARDTRAARITIRDGINYGLARPRELPTSTNGAGNTNGYHAPEPAHVNGTAATLPPPAPKQEAPVTRDKQKTVWTPDLSVVSIGDLLSEPDVNNQWLVDDMLMAGGASLMAASPKVGKSTLARSLARDVATGGRFLRRDTMQGPVVYFALEEKREKVKEYFRAMGLTGAHPLHIIFEAPKPGEELLTVAYFAEKYEARLVIIDPIIVFSPIKDVNDYTEVYRALKPIHKLAQDMEFHALVLHHGKKPNTMIKFDPTSTDTSDVMGSQGFKGAVDTVMVMRKAPSNGLRTVFTEQRYGSDLPVTVLDLSRDTWYVSSLGPYDKWHLANAERSIIDYLREQGQSQTELAIREGAHQDATVCAVAIRRLVDDGALLRSGVGRAGKPYYYELPT